MSSIGSAPPPPSGDASGQAQAAAEGTAGGSHEASMQDWYAAIRKATAQS